MGVTEREKEKVYYFCKTTLRTVLGTYTDSSTEHTPKIAAISHTRTV